MKLTTFYLIACILGTLIPWLFFTTFFLDLGLNIPAFLGAVFANGAAGGFASDLMISILVFWIWSYWDANQLHIKSWWLVIPASCFVGLSLALPLYLYMRSKRLQRVTL